MEPLAIEDIKASILAHRDATGTWPTARSGAVEYGPYRGRETWRAIDSALEGKKAPDGTAKQSRGLPGGSSLVTLNAEVSTEHGLDYINRKQRAPLAIEDIKASILAHRAATGTWPTAESGAVEYGAYRSRETWRAIDAALKGVKAPNRVLKRFRRLPGGSSLATLNAEVSAQHGLDYVNHSRRDPLTIEDINASILAHRDATGTWPTATSGAVEYGPYRGRETWRAIDSALEGRKAPDGTAKQSRGLPGGSSLAKLKQELSIESEISRPKPHQQSRHHSPSL